MGGYPECYGYEPLLVEEAGEFVVRVFCAKVRVHSERKFTDRREGLRWGREEAKLLEAGKSGVLLWEAVLRQRARLLEERLAELEPEPAQLEFGGAEGG